MSIMSQDSEGALALEPLEARRAIKELCGLRDEDVDAFIQEGETNVVKLHPKQPKSQANNARFLSDLAHVAKRLEKYYEPNEIRNWLNLPHPQLSNKERAINVIRDGRTNEILNIIKRLDDAVYL